jgi:hypothetical protein
LTVLILSDHIQVLLAKFHSQRRFRRPRHLKEPIQKLIENGAVAQMRADRSFVERDREHPYGGIRQTGNRGSQSR